MIFELTLNRYNLLTTLNQRASLDHDTLVSWELTKAFLKVFTKDILNVC